MRQGLERQTRKEFDYCPECGREVDTGWECNGCDRDWRDLAQIYFHGYFGSKLVRLKRKLKTIFK